MDTNGSTSIPGLEPELMLFMSRSLKRASQTAAMRGRTSESPGEAMEYGMLAEALENAGAALFNVVNVASSYLALPEAKQALAEANRPAEEPAESEAVS